MNIVFAAAECVPFVKVGGLGDVVGALPSSLARLGHSVRVFMPHYGLINDERFGIEPYHTFEMMWNEATTRVEVARAVQGGVEHYFLRGWPFFAPDEPFVYHPSDEGIDVGRFLFFCAAMLRFVRWLGESEGWRPDIFHLHDWHTALAAHLLTRVYYEDAILGAAPTVFSIHNLRYQGWGPGWHLDRAGLPPVEHSMLRAIDRADNCMAIGIAYSTMISTVSPRYAQEILTPEGGFGLDGLLHARLSRLVGILNGVDVSRWNPATSAHLPQPFDVESLEKRVENKLALQAELGLPQDASVPIVAAVMRLVDQKGTDILHPAIRHMLEHTDMQFVLLGTGQYEYEQAFWWIGRDFPEKAAIKLMFSEPLSERIYAGSDMFVMPSLFEPCGIGQMIAMRYGSLPVVRAIGGLADTVPPDVGFLFQDYSPGAVQWALNRALDVYYNHPDDWRERQRRAMLTDFSWESSARRYVELYERARVLRSQYA